ncbi:unnamed protein product [Ranitomeya imitator]|uniref:TNFR-Cys domain-containing protein n=1 Tax=Ranitomeya imitator TaxID=111125 RepID=A0ABN9M8R4_9NEOB|nr:unnamed protein product [Ranitomeya imitator]
MTSWGFPASAWGTQIACLCETNSFTYWSPREEMVVAKEEEKARGCERDNNISKFCTVVMQAGAVGGWITVIEGSHVTRQTVSEGAGAEEEESSELQCDDKEYEKNNRCCSLCDPGERLLEDCTELNKTLCIPCSVGEYQEKYNRETSCLLHKECNEQLGFQIISKGTSTQNVDCRCQSGKHCSSEACETCVLNKLPDYLTHNAHYAKRGRIQAKNQMWSHVKTGAILLRLSEFSKLNF